MWANAIYIYILKSFTVNCEPCGIEGLNNGDKKLMRVLKAETDSRLFNSRLRALDNHHDDYILLWWKQSGWY